MCLSSLFLFLYQAKLSMMSQALAKRDKGFVSIEEELELLGSSSETINQVPLTTCAAVQSMKDFTKRQP